jgi:hypothetical protein
VREAGQDETGSTTLPQQIAPLSKR